MKREIWEISYSLIAVIRCDWYRLVKVGRKLRLNGFLLQGIRNGTAHTGTIVFVLFCSKRFKLIAISYVAQKERGVVVTRGPFRSSILRAIFLCPLPTRVLDSNPAMVMAHRLLEQLQTDPMDNFHHWIRLQSPSPSDRRRKSE